MKNNVIKLDMFEVVCKCGHVGKSHYVKIHFHVLARSGKEAARSQRRHFERLENRQEPFLRAPRK